LPKSDLVLSEELASPRRVTALPNIILPALEEAEKEEEEEAISVPRRREKCRMNNSGT